MFLYVVFIIIQIICLYYEYNEKKLFLFFGNKELLFCSILIDYIFKDNAMMLFIYIIGLILLINFVDKKYEENYSKRNKISFTRRYFLYFHIRVNVFLYNIN